MAEMGSITLVAAVSENRVIGRNGELPWRLPADLRRFRRLTLGHPVLMGRKTFDSIGKALDGRDNWVLSRDLRFAAPGVRVFRTLDVALAAARELDLMVIGGAQLYAQTLPHATHLELTCVRTRAEGDTFFPVLDPDEWHQIAHEHHPADARHAHACDFVTLLRRSGQSHRELSFGKAYG
jgi:dihydrofolate reductase